MSAAPSAPATSRSSCLVASTSTGFGKLAIAGAEPEAGNFVGRARRLDRGRHVRIGALDGQMGFSAPVLGIFVEVTRDAFTVT